MKVAKSRIRRNILTIKGGGREVKGHKDTGGPPL